MISSYPHSIDWAHPLIKEWFVNQFETPTAPQIEGWPGILAGEHTLISAPTGSGKTFAAFMVCIDQLLRAAVENRLENQIEVIYISPLKALGNDIQKNLLGPLKQIQQNANAAGIIIDDIRVAVRTGDTPAKDRQSMLKKPPHILVTTPESFYLLLTAEKSRALLKTVRTVIVDEIHALVNSKRGTHLALSLERLEKLACELPVRIGLSATQKPIEEVAKFLSGSSRAVPNIINIGHQRHLDLKVEVPKTALESVTSNDVWDEIYDRVAELAMQNRSTLVFVNTRKLSERMSHHLANRIGKEWVAAHHGSLSRKLRLAAENGLKTGALKVIVATASLELGIDIGTVDLVCQIGSPRALAAALQRVGRAGHWHGAISRGHFFATTRDELLECAALVYGIYSGDLDRLIIPEQPLDILAQQIVAACATDEWNEDELFKLVKRSYPYRHLKREVFNTVLEMLSEGIAASRGRYGAYLFRDRINGIVKGRRGSRMAAIMNGGAIPETNLFTVIAVPEEIVVGTLDEEFAVESHRGDVILLGNTSWRVYKVENTRGRVIVEDAQGAAPTVPFWLGEAPARSNELSLQVSSLRTKIDALLPLSTATNPESQKKAREWLAANCHVSDYAAGQMIDYLLEGRALLGAVPSQQTIIAERFFDESGGMQLIIHAPFGARINKAWGLALRKRFCRSFNFELQAAATDDGLAISLAEQHSFPLEDVFQFLHPATIKKVLVQAVLQSPVFTTRWRWDAIRALALMRYRNGRKVPPNILRMRADDLLAAVFPQAAACQDNLAGKDVELPEHPLIDETIKDCLTEAMDIEGLRELLKGIKSGTIHCIAVDTPTPSVFSHEILNANPYAFLDDAPLEERRTRAVAMRRILPEWLQGNMGQLDSEVIADVQRQAWPDIRNADELHDFLQTMIGLSRDNLRIPDSWAVFFEQLQNANRAGTAHVDGQAFWVATEKKNAYQAVYPSAVFSESLIEWDSQLHEADDALLMMLRGWMQHLGPVNVGELVDLLKLPESQINNSLLKLEASGQILRGHFRKNQGMMEWCERRLLARIHQQTLAKLRKEIEPVSALQFIRWLAKWQHITGKSQLKGEQGVLEVIRQLQAYEIPANAWEKQIFAKRISDYSPDLLDRLCLSGVVIWGRPSLHPSIESSLKEKDLEISSYKSIQANSVTPITFLIREESGWLAGKSAYTAEELKSLSYNAQVVYTYLQTHGASFFSDIVSDVQKLKTEVENALWELVAAGLISADSFDNLRAMIDPQRRTGRRPRRHNLFSQGRWSLLRAAKPVEPERRIESICRILLKRYGVCFREIVMREKIAASWSELLSGFRRLEAQGEIRGGRFISGFTGEQFALAYAVDSLRAAPAQTDAQEISIFAVDPLNLVGVLLPGEKIPSRSGKQLILRT
ncbi:helicase, DEAD/DEAH box family [Legionella quinlivanii]|uniref:Helicase, DEAD/DEAH box family n=2 Tax=Legionella quinlivanii TaxID=45073 RepID=A0A0W0Y074_9GAMM|nr:helicase, DEAD/DEAH box family [Legionella quinlivanii]SEF40062.1 ATP-dependent helicase Lhr and Lhr-like helicase [Legionella quinlivanii DSM 21216]STY12045.1 helicase, DEAD/DEAH box family [Legionella quinlivanii]